MKNIGKFVKRSALSIVAVSAFGFVFPECSKPREEYPVPQSAQLSAPAAVELPSVAV
jgi:hypothetical protein